MISVRPFISLCVYLLRLAPLFQSEYILVQTVNEQLDVKSLGTFLHFPVPIYFLSNISHYLLLSLSTTDTANEPSPSWAVQKSSRGVLGPISGGVMFLHHSVMISFPPISQAMTPQG